MAKIVELLHHIFHSKLNEIKFAQREAQLAKCRELHIHQTPLEHLNEEINFQIAKVRGCAGMTLWF